MARIHRVSFYIADELDHECSEIENEIMKTFCDGDFEIVHQLHVDSSEKFNADSMSEEFGKNCDLAHLAKHFPANSEFGDAKRVNIGGFYRHFKGKLVHVIAVSRHTETNEMFVVYACDNGSGTWVRPLDMFLSEVDREKYPEAKQKYRFEPLSDDA